MQDRTKTKTFSNTKLIFWGYFFCHLENYPLLGIPLLRVKVYFLQMKPTVFYTLFLGIFLAGGVAGQEPRLVLPVGHNEKILKTGLSDDGKRVLTVGNDKSFKVWDLNTGLLLFDLIWPGSNPAFLVFSPDGKKAATTSDDNILSIWDVASGNLLCSLKGHSSAIKMAKFSPDGSFIATTSRDKTVKIWNVATASLSADLKGLESNATCLEFNTETSKIAVATILERKILIWDINSSRLIADLERHTDRINNIEFDYMGQKLVSASDDGFAIVWDVNSGKIISTLEGHTKLLKSARFNPDGSKVVTSSWDKTAKIWEVNTGKEIFNLQHDKFVNSAVFNHSGNSVVTASDDGFARIWNSENGLLLGVLDDPQHFLIEDAYFIPSDKKIITTARDFTIKIWDATSYQLLKTLGTHVYRFNTAEFNKQNTKILTASDDGTARIWNIASGKTDIVFNGHENAVNAATFLSSDNNVLTASADATVILSDADSDNIITHFKGGHERSIIMLELSKDETKFLTASSDLNTVVWDINDVEKPILLPAHKIGVTTAHFSPDGKRVVTTGFDDKAYIYDLQTIDVIELNGFKSSLSTSCFNPTGETLITGGFNPIVQIWNPANGKLIKELIGHTSSVNMVVYSPDGKKILTASDDKTARIWDAQTGHQLVLLNQHEAAINAVSFSPDGNFILTASDDKTVKIWDTYSGNLIGNFNSHTKRVTEAHFSHDGKKAVTISDDNTCKVWDIEKVKLLYTFLSLDSLDYFILTPNRYYKTTPAAAKLLHYVNKDQKVITFEQLDVKYNRPDKVLEAIGNTDTALIKSYRKAYEKRIKKLGIDTTAFRDGYSVPEADFINRDNIEYEQRTGILALRIKGEDSTYKLDRFNVWINETPIFGQRGFSLKKKSTNSLDTTITIKLSQGENRIETSVTNVNGTESYRMPLYVNYTPAVKQKESLRFIGIGIDRFSEKGHDLQYSVKDIRDLSAKLKEKYGNDIQIDTLFNENVNSSKVSALKKQLQQTSVNDKVILAYSGHGLLSKDYDYYLSTYTVNFSKPEQNGLPYEELENLLDSIPARRKLMLIDACHSGEVDKEEMARITDASDSLQQQGTKGGKPTYTGTTTLGMKNSFELMQSLFVNVGKSTGATVISAAAGTQFALERGDLRNGVFTYSILEAMNKYPSIKISELRKIVGERVVELTNGLQRPTSRNETVSVDWEF